jgi:hypothetical protein
LLCSPRARASSFVNDEIRQFAAARGAENIIPLLIDGLPNNEALPQQEAQKSFPDALCEAMQMPLAGDYRNFDARRDKLDKGAFHGCWYTLLANLLELSRSEIEQRDQKRAARRRAITIGTVSGVIALLSIAFVITLFAQREAVRQRDQAEHRRIVALTKLSLRLSSAGLSTNPSPDAQKEQRCSSTSRPWAGQNTISFELGGTLPLGEGAPLRRTSRRRSVPFVSCCSAMPASSRQEAG